MIIKDWKNWKVFNRTLFVNASRDVRVIVVVAIVKYRAVNIFLEKSPTRLAVLLVAN